MFAPKSWYSKDAEGLTLRFKVVPGSSKNSLEGILGDPESIKVKIQSPPVDGAANEALLKWLKKELGKGVKGIEIIRGQKSREKQVFLKGDPQALEALVLLWLKNNGIG